MAAGDGAGLRIMGKPSDAATKQAPRPHVAIASSVAIWAAVACTSQRFGFTDGKILLRRRGHLAPQAVRQCDI